MANPYEQFTANPYRRFSDPTIVPAPAPVQEPEQESPGFWGEFGRGAMRSLENIGQVYPVLEGAAHLATAAVAAPVAGYAGLAGAALPGKFGQGAKWQKAVQDTLTYTPQTQRGQEVVDAISAPLELLDKVGGIIADPLAEAGHPYAAATVHSATSALPVLAGGATGVLKARGANPAVLSLREAKAIRQGSNKAVKAGMAKQKTIAQTDAYLRKMDSAVSDIIRNKNEIKLLDKNGDTVSRLPRTLSEFDQAIAQAKELMFNESEALLKKTDAAAKNVRKLEYPVKEGEKVGFDAAGKGVNVETPFTVNLKNTTSEISKLLDDAAIEVFSPETAQYIKSRMDKMHSKGNMSAAATERSIQILNQSLDAYYKNPSHVTKGRAMVDSMIAHKLRQQLDSVVQKATGKEYQPFKTRYGNLKAIEQDVHKAALKDARQVAGKGFTDFSGVVSAAEVIRGLTKADPAALTTGLALKGIQKIYRLKNDPNRIIKSMFQDVEKLQQLRQF